MIKCAYFKLDEIKTKQNKTKQKPNKYKMELLNKREKEEQKESKKDILYELYYIFKNQNQHF